MQEDLLFSVSAFLPPEFLAGGQYVLKLVKVSSMNYQWVVIIQGGRSNQWTMLTQCEYDRDAGFLATQLHSPPNVAVPERRGRGPGRLRNRQRGPQHVPEGPLSHRGAARGFEVLLSHHAFDDGPGRWGQSTSGRQSRKEAPRVVARGTHGWAGGWVNVCVCGCEWIDGRAGMGRWRGMQLFL